MRSGFASGGKKIGARIAVGLHALFGSRSGTSFGILMYHRVTDGSPGLPTPTWNVTPARFRDQLQGLLDRGYRFRSLRNVIETVRDGRPLPAKTAVVTFDDGYENVFLNAWPVLKALDVPATVFAATSVVGSDGPFPFDSWGTRYHAETSPRDWRALTWPQCLEMERSGIVEIGSHSHSHEDFRDKEADFELDLRRSIAALREHLGREDFTFAFPYGGRSLGYASDGLMRAARRAGALCALTTETELVAAGSSPFGWGRLEAVQSDTAASLAAKLGGWYGWMGGVRAVFRFVSPPKRSVPPAGKKPGS